MAPRGEVLAARAAAQAGIPFCLSTVGVCAIEEVRAACPEPFWFQLYLMRDRGYARELVQRARAADCSALVLTADLAATGVRRRDQRHAALTGAPMAMQLRRSLQVLSRPGWIRRVALGGRPLLFGNLAAAVPDGRNIEAFKSWVDAQFDASVTWRDVEWLRSLWDGPLIVKGILDADDARAAAAAGATGVVVSNHGGRQLDGAPSSISALPAVIEAVGDRLEVLVDGGVRSGADLAKALALGAQGAQVGRPWAYAAAVGGQAGVGAMIASLKRELDTTLALMGLDSVAALDRSALVD
jgi:L-lactate dehydrogenase (cytochrome)